MSRNHVTGGYQLDSILLSTGSSSLRLCPTHLLTRPDLCRLPHAPIITRSLHRQELLTALFSQIGLAHFLPQNVRATASLDLARSFQLFVLIRAVGAFDHCCDSNTFGNVASQSKFFGPIIWSTAAAEVATSSRLSRPSVASTLILSRRGAQQLGTRKEGPEEGSERSHRCGCNTNTWFYRRPDGNIRCGIQEVSTQVIRVSIAS